MLALRIALKERLGHPWPKVNDELGCMQVLEKHKS